MMKTETYQGLGLVVGMTHANEPIVRLKNGQKDTNIVVVTTRGPYVKIGDLVLVRHTMAPCGIFKAPTRKTDFVPASGDVVCWGYFGRIVEPAWMNPGGSVHVRLTLEAGLAGLQVGDKCLIEVTKVEADGLYVGRSIGPVESVSEPPAFMGTGDEHDEDRRPDLAVTVADLAEA